MMMMFSLRHHKASETNKNSHTIHTRSDTLTTLPHSTHARTDLEDLDDERGHAVGSGRKKTLRGKIQTHDLEQQSPEQYLRSMCSLQVLKEEKARLRGRYSSESRDAGRGMFGGSSVLGVALVMRRGTHGARSGWLSSTCVRRFARCVKALLHQEHGNGRCIVCTTTCRSS